MEKKSILEEATEIRNGNRDSDYGDAVENFRRIAQMAGLISGKEITPEECCSVLMAVKLCREGYKHKRDNLVDLCGYADIMELIKDGCTDRHKEPLENEIFKFIAKTLEYKCDIPQEDISLDTEIESLCLDSLDGVELLMEITNEYKEISISDNECENLTTIQDFVNLVKIKINKLHEN